MSFTQESCSFALIQEGRIWREDLVAIEEPRCPACFAWGLEPGASLGDAHGGGPWVGGVMRWQFASASQRTHPIPQNRITTAIEGHIAITTSKLFSSRLAEANCHADMSCSITYSIGNSAGRDISSALIESISGEAETNDFVERVWTAAHS